MNKNTLFYIIYKENDVVTYFI